jgi:hypothetical protein
LRFKLSKSQQVCQQNTLRRVLETSFGGRGYLLARRKSSTRFSGNGASDGVLRLFSVDWEGARLRDSLGCLRGTGGLRADQALALKCRRCSCGGSTRFPSAAAHVNIAEHTQKSSALSAMRLAGSRVAAAVAQILPAALEQARRRPEAQERSKLHRPIGLRDGAVPPHGCLTELGIDEFEKGLWGSLLSCAAVAYRREAGWQPAPQIHKAALFPKTVKHPRRTGAWCTRRQCVLGPAARLTVVCFRRLFRTSVSLGSGRLRLESQSRPKRPRNLSDAGEQTFASR